MNKLNILAFAAHSDDTELACSGILHSHIQMGYKVGVIDLTEGELGSRGTIETRYTEAANASKLLGLNVRDNLQLADGFFENNKQNQLKIIQAIRKYQPEIILMNAPKDRHPDHGKGAQLVKDAAFLSGLIKIETFSKSSELQQPWRPKKAFHYIQDMYLEPDLIIDITESWDAKINAIKCFETQFFSANLNDGPETYISKNGFLDSIEARAKEFGKRIGVKYGEGLIISGQNLGLKDLFHQVLPTIA
jgi:N-acetylglucosamine malate deacetylase 1